MTLSRHFVPRCDDFVLLIVLLLVIVRSDREHDYDHEHEIIWLRLPPCDSRWIPNLAEKGV